jgi:hypothetical protein
MTMAAAIATLVGAGTESGVQGPVVAPAGPDVSEPGSGATSAGAGPTPTWLSFLEALGVSGDLAIGHMPATVPISPSGTSSQPSGISEKSGSPVTVGTPVTVPGNLPGSSAGALPGMTARSGKKSDIKTETHHERKLKANEKSAPVQTVVVPGAAPVAAITAPVSLGHPNVEKSPMRSGRSTDGSSRDQHVSARGLGNGKEIGGDTLHATVSLLKSETAPHEGQSMDGRTPDVNLQTASSGEPQATAGTDRKGAGTETVDLTPPVTEKAATGFAQPAGLANNPVESIEAGPSTQIAERKTDTLEAVSANHSQKNARPSNGSSLRGLASGRGDLSEVAINQGRPPDAVQLQWSSVAPSHIPSELTAVGYRTGNNLSTVHPAGAGASDTFAALDGERMAAPATWIHAGTHHAEAGYLDPSLGWVGVRADAVGNGVHAALLPGSGEAAQVLGSHLAGLSTYLSEHHGESATVTLDAPQDALSWTGSGAGGQAGQDHLARGGTNQGRQEWQDKSVVASGSETQSREVSHAAAPAGIPARAGRHISVMA